MYPSDKPISNARLIDKETEINRQIQTDTHTHRHTHRGCERGPESSALNVQLHHRRY